MKKIHCFGYWDQWYTPIFREFCTRKNCFLSYLKGKAKHIANEFYESQKINLELTCQHNFSRYKDKQHNSWLYHSINKARKQFRFVTVKYNRKKLKMALFNYFSIIFETQYTLKLHIKAVLKSYFAKNPLAMSIKLVLSVLGNFLYQSRTELIFSHNIFVKCKSS